MFPPLGAGRGVDQATCGQKGSEWTRGQVYPAEGKSVKVAEGWTGTGGDLPLLVITVAGWESVTPDESSEIEYAI